MKRFVEIEYHDYMDLMPRTEVRVFEGIDEEILEKNVNDFVNHMKEHWCSGTTRLIGIMEQWSALSWIEQQIAKEHADWQEDSEEFINKICNLFKECYDADAKELLHYLDVADDYASREW